MGIFDTSFYIFHFALHIPLIGSINLNGIYKKIEYFDGIYNEGIINGRGGEARTPNTRFWRPVLYQLNYAPIGIKNWRNGRDSNPRPPA